MADLIVIGAGPGGYGIAAQQAAKGLDVVVIEKDKAGGTCLNRGCIPTKCLCATAAAVHHVKDAGDYGVNIPAPGVISVDWTVARQRMQGVVDNLRGQVDALLSRCTIVHGTAVIEPDGAVRVGDQRYTAPKVLIATGSKPATLPIPGAGLAMDSDKLLAMDALPGSAVIIGGGVIGLEFAHILSSCGVAVTVLEYAPEILPPFDRDIAKRLRSLLGRRGIDIVTGARVTGISADGDSMLTVEYETRKGTAFVRGDSVVQAVGRVPVIPGGLAQAGIDLTPRGAIATDATMMTTRPGFYAVGDCNGRMMLAHAASAQARVAMGEDIDLDVVPAAVFVSPEVAMVGATAATLDAAGKKYQTGKAMFAGNGKALAAGETDGFVKVYADPETNLILGAHILGPHAADLIQEFATAMANGLTATQLALHTIHGHPTLGEVCARACESLR